MCVVEWQLEKRGRLQGRGQRPGTERRRLSAPRSASGGVRQRVRIPLEIGVEVGISSAPL